VEALEERDRDEDDDGLLAVADLNLEMNPSMNVRGRNRGCPVALVPRMNQNLPALPSHST
jgi:hypothetical protein